MKKLFLIFVFILFFCFSVSAKIILVSNEDYRIVGVQIFNFKKEYKDKLDDYFRELKKNGVNTVFVRVFQNKGDRFHFNIRSNCKVGVYFKTDYACTINDILPDIIKFARKYKIKVFAWMGTRKLSFLVDRFGVNQTFFLGSEKRKGYGVDIFSSESFKKILGLFKDLAKYNIDGILLQDDFIVRIDESASKSAIYKFYVDYGERISSMNSWKELPEYFFKWKKDYLAKMLNFIKWETKKINPKIKFAVNIYYESLMNSKKGVKWYGQDVKTYDKMGFTYMACMLYSEQIIRELRMKPKSFLVLFEHVIKKWVGELKDPNRFVAKLQIRKFEPGKPKIDKTFFTNLCGIIGRYNVSYVLVPFEDLSDLTYICND